MKKVLVLLLIAFSLEESLSTTKRSMFLNLENGNLCMQSLQCKSNCCLRTSGISMARCAKKAAENQQCSPKHLYGVYYKCPCESGLTCEVDRTIVGTITNSDFGICHDSRKLRKVNEKTK